MGYINTMESALKTFQIGSNYIHILPDNTVPVDELLEDYKFETCTSHSGSTLNGDYYTFQAVMQYVNSGGNSSTLGALNIEFDVINTSSYTTTPRSTTIQLPYTIGN